MIEQLIAALGNKFDLNGEEIVFTGKEIADIIWLALQMQPSEQARKILPQPNPGSPEIPNLELPAPGPQPESVTSPSPSPQTPPANVYPGQRNNEKTLAGIDGLLLRIADAPSLREPLNLARSLRPFIRRVPSGAKTILDEAATVQQIAEQQVLMPVLTPAPEPWLDLALIVDESSSMLIWHHTIAELKRLLENYGIFRKVTVWGLVTNEKAKEENKNETGKQKQIRIRPGIDLAARNQGDRSCNEIIDPSGRCLILIATDCIASYWHTGAVLPALKSWSQSGPTAIVQMLPEWLWNRTALALATPVRFSALTPGVPSQQLVTKPLSVWDEVDLKTGIKIPVVTLEPERFAAWSQLVSGKSGSWFPGFVFEPELFEPVEAEFFERVEDEVGEQSTSTITAEQRVQQFYISASPIAWRLAELLAAAPIITLPVVRIVQFKLLSNSRQVNIAEVFLSGLLERLSEPEPGTHPDYIEYDFVDGVREVLHDSIFQSDSIKVNELVTQEVASYIAERLGLSVETFVAKLRDPNQSKKLAKQARPLATVATPILKKLGGEYADFAEKLEKEIKPQEPPSKKGGEDVKDGSTTTLTPEQRFRKFLQSASITAWQLARLLSAAPVITLPIIRLVQDKLLPNSRQINVVQEVLSSGLLEPISQPEPGIPPEDIQYDFVDGLRKVLLHSIPSNDSNNVLNEVSSYIAESLGIAREIFAAIIQDPKQIKDEKIASQIRSIAAVNAQISKQPGEEHARCAKELAVQVMHQLINNLEDEKEILKAIAQQVYKLVNFELFIVTLYNNDKTHIRRLFTYFLKEDVVDESTIWGVRWWEMPPFVARIEGSKETEVFDIDELLKQQEWQELRSHDQDFDDYLNQGFRYSLRHPVIEAGKTIASVTLHRKAKQAFSKEQKEMVQALPLAEAIVRVLEYEKQKRREFFINLIKDIGLLPKQLPEQKNNIHNIAKRIVNGIGELYNWDNVSIFEVDEEKKEIRLLSQSEPIENKTREYESNEIIQFKTNYTQSINEGVIGYVYKKKKGVNIGNVKLPKWKEIYLSTASETLSELCLPIFINERVCLLLNVEDSQRNAFVEEEKRQLEDLILPLLKSLFEKLLHNDEF